MNPTRSRSQTAAAALIVVESLQERFRAGLERIAELKAQLRATREELGETDADNPAIQAILDEHWR